MSIKKLFNIVFISFLFIQSFSLVKASSPEISELGRFRHLKDPSLAYGVAALESHLLENCRLHGKYSALRKDYPSIHLFRDKSTTSLKKDCPQGYVEAFLQYLFPSLDLRRLSESTKPSEFSFKLASDKRMIGRVLRTLRDTKINEAEVLLTGAILGAFNPDLIHKKAQDKASSEILRGKKKSQSDPLFYIYETLGRDAFDVFRGGDPSDPRVLAALTAKAFLNSSKHPPQIVEQALWALAWKTSTSAKEVALVYEGLDPDTEIELGKAYSKAESYDIFKTKASEGTFSVEVTKIASDPFLATYIGAGYQYYEGLFPPSFFKGAAKYKGNFFSTCAETSLWNLFNCLLWSEKDKEFKIDRLKDLAKDLKFSIELTPEELSLSFPDLEWSRLKQLAWFYTRYPTPIQSKEALDQWTSVVSNIPGIFYKKSLSSGESYEILSCKGLPNMLNLMGALIPHPKLVKGSSEHRLTFLCDFFSSKDYQFTWGLSDMTKSLENLDLEIQFSINEDLFFNWFFCINHITSEIVDKKPRWQEAFEDDIFPFFQKQNPCPQLNFYLSSKKASFLLPSLDPPYFWTTAYGNLHLKKGVKAILTAFFKNQKREEYGWVESLMKRLCVKQQTKHSSMREAPDSHQFITECVLNDWELVVSEKISEWIKKIIIKVLDIKGNQLIYRFAEKGRINCIKALLNRDRIDPTLEKHTKEKTLMAATKKGRLNVVDFILERGADPNAQSKKVMTPLMWAALRGDLRIFNRLLKAGARIDLITEEGETLLMWAARGGNLEILKLLRKRKAPIDAVDKNGYTALMCAAVAGSLDAVKWFIKKKADINIKNKTGSSALVLSWQNGRDDVTEFLLSKSADPEATNGAGQTGLMWFSKKGNLRLVNLFLEYGACIHAKDSCCNSALSFSRLYGHPLITQALIKNGAVV